MRIFLPGSWALLAAERGPSLLPLTTQPNNKIKVDGRVSAIAILARLFGIERVATVSSGVAQRKEVEIMMVLDRSGSMAGTPSSRP